MKLDPRTLSMVGLSVAFSVPAQLVLRAGMSGHAGLEGPALLAAAFTSPVVWAGIGLYALGAVTWLVVLSRIDLAVAYPLGALNFVLVTLLARFVLGEAVDALRWAGVGCIFLGVLVVAHGEHGQHDESGSPDRDGHR